MGAGVDFGTRAIYPGPKTTKEASNETPISKDESNVTGITGIGLDEIETQMSVLDLEKRWGAWQVLFTTTSSIERLTFTVYKNFTEKRITGTEGGWSLPAPTSSRSYAWSRTHSTPSRTICRKTMVGPFCLLPQRSTTRRHPRRGKWRNRTREPPRRAARSPAGEEPNEIHSRASESVVLRES